MGVLYIEQEHLITAPAKRNYSFNLPNSNQGEEGVEALMEGPAAGGGEGGQGLAGGDLPKIPSCMGSFPAAPTPLPSSSWSLMFDPRPTLNPGFQSLTNA